MIVLSKVIDLNWFLLLLIPLLSKSDQNTWNGATGVVVDLIGVASKARFVNEIDLADSTDGGTLSGLRRGCSDSFLGWLNGPCNKSAPVVGALHDSKAMVTSALNVAL